MSHNIHDKKTLDYIKRSSALIAEAEKRASLEDKKAEQVSSLIPVVADALVTHNRIPAELREKAATQLADHAKTLEILASVAAHRTDDEATHMGKGVKTASANSSDSDERESDITLLKRMGVR